ncbi:MAG: hypothetical protein PHN66_01890 [Candidatus Shapirobacteria bacterium]|nr:hypothetical protein [Candidatus Shapirobacteria bacterium]
MIILLRVRLFFKRLFYFLGLIEVTAKCGHKTRVRSRVEITDENGRVLERGRIENELDPRFCIGCLKEKIIVD